MITGGPFSRLFESCPAKNTKTRKQAASYWPFQNSPGEKIMGESGAKRALYTPFFLVAAFSFPAMAPALDLSPLKAEIES